MSLQIYKSIGRLFWGLLLQNSLDPQLGLAKGMGNWKWDDVALTSCRSLFLHSITSVSQTGQKIR